MRDSARAGVYYCVIPAHNRRDTTLACLRRLRENGDAEWIRIIVVDDGSTDGTAEAISEEFPEVTLLRGDGDLWWAGAIAMGTRQALEREDCAGAIWLNDDCRPKVDCLRTLVDAAVEGIRVAQSVTAEGFVYGGKRRTGFGMKTVEASGTELVEVDSFAGNCVCIPVWVLRKIGNVDATNLAHNFADTDYGLRAKRSGVPIWLCPSAMAENDTNDGPGFASWRRDQRSTVEIYRTFASLKSMMHWPSRTTFYVRHWGQWGWVLAAQPYFRFMVIAALRAWTRPHRLRSAHSSLRGQQ